jgi:hypothetical protein
MSVLLISCLCDHTVAVCTQFVCITNRIYGCLHCRLCSVSVKV